MTIYKFSLSSQSKEMIFNKKLFWTKMVFGRARMIQDRKADVKMVVEVNDYRYCVFPPPKYLTLSKIVLAVLLTFKMVKE